jgi:hypothetical protein
MNWSNHSQRRKRSIYHIDGLESKSNSASRTLENLADELRLPGRKELDAERLAMLHNPANYDDW